MKQKYSCIISKYEFGVLLSVKSHSLNPDSRNNPEKVSPMYYQFLLQLQNALAKYGAKKHIE